MPARISSLRVLRGLLRGWLARASWPRAAGEDVVQAVNAAAGNAVIHAGLDPDDMVDVSIWVTAGPGRIRRQVVVRVRDHGRWRPHAAGRGLALMQALMDRVRIEGQPPSGGTEVTLVSPAVPRRALRDRLGGTQGDGERFRPVPSGMVTVPSGSTLLRALARRIGRHALDRREPGPPKVRPNILPQ